MRCPDCSSLDIEIVDYHNRRCIVCSNCGFDERAEMDTMHIESGEAKEEAHPDRHKQQ